MQILRHSRIAVTTEIYTGVPSAATRDALKKFGRRVTLRWRVSSAYHCAKSAAYATSPRDSAKGLPTSEVTRVASADWSAIIDSAMSCSTPARVLAVVRPQVLNAPWAAPMAAVTSVAGALGQLPMTAPVAGSRTSIRAAVSTRAGGTDSVPRPAAPVIS